MKNFFIMRYLRFSLYFILTAAFMHSCVSSDLEPEIHFSDPAVLHASYAGGRATKTEFGDRTTTNSYAQINWSAGDAVSLFCDGAEGSFYFLTQESGPTAAFVNQSTDAQPSGSSYLGLYPYNQEATADFASSSILTSIPSSQRGFAGRFDSNALLAVGKSSTLDMAFYNVCSGLCFTLKDGGKYSQISISGRSGEMLAGNVSISLSNPATPVAAPASQGSESTVWLVPFEGGTFASGVEYYIMFRPQDFQNGFTMSFYEPSANNPSVTCTCTSYVSFKRGVFARISNVDDPSKLAAIRDGTNLASDGETANCYIVSEPGSYKFPMVTGNESDEVLGGVTKVDVLWETANTGTAPKKGDIIKDVTFNGRFVYFNTPSSLKDGNAVIAAYKGSEIVWSWHIWVCSGYDAEASAQTLYGKTRPMMDRNLGALSKNDNSALANGLFYQWGRKDPFPGAVESYVSADGGAGTFWATTAGTLKTHAATGVTVDYVVAHPDEFITSTDGYWLPVAINSLWGITVSNAVETAVKSVYDPCPPGWKVPRARVMSGGQHNVSEEAWAGLDATGLYLRVSTGLYLNTTASGVRAWYPTNGYIDRNGKVIMVGQYACYWSCSFYSGGMSFALQLSRDMSGKLLWNPIQYGKLNGEGHSVRCIKDN